MADQLPRIWRMPEGRLPHWTDDIERRPIFSTVLSVSGPATASSILGAAEILLKQVGVPQDRIEDLRIAVIEAPSYEAAIGEIERWFRVDRGLD